MKRIAAALAVLISLLAGSTLWAQGVLIIVDPPHPVPLPRPWPHPHPRPEPPQMSYKIKELAMQARVQDQIAQVQVTQSFVNTGSQQMEVKFCFPLPYDGAIERMTFLVDGKEYEAKLLDAKEARTIFEGYVRRNKDPALLEWVGVGMFQTSVFPVPPGAERKVTLKYSQLLKKNHQLTDFLFPLSGAKYTSTPIEKLILEASIESQHDIKAVYSPSHSINVTRPDSKHAIVKLEASNTVPTSDFRLLYDTADGKLGASVISYRPSSDEEGFFLLLASPEVKSAKDDRPAKTVIFVVDRSGSMSGKKFEQAREAAKFVLNNLREGDTFNVIAYDTVVESFKPELQKYDEATRKAALGFIDGIYAGGSTNIDGALTAAMGMIKDHNRPNFVLFLTDGLPTAGETNESKICASIKGKNDYRARVISFGVGYDLNSRLLDRLSRDNHGQSEYVRPDDNIESSVSRLYSKMSSPVMTNVSVKVDVEGMEGHATSRVYPKDTYDLFSGEQLVQVGRYKKSGNAKIVISGKIGDEEKKFDFPGTFVDKSSDQSYAFVEKLWAMRRIGEILEEIDLSGRNDELVKELVGLSTKHGILTPYTSYLADDQAGARQLADSRMHFESTRRGLQSLEQSEGRSGVAQRAAKNEFKYAENAPAAPAAGFGGGFKKDGQGLDRAGGANSFRDIESDKLVQTDAVQSAGNQTLYRRGRTWIAENAKDVDVEKDKNVQKIKQFSDEYFALVKANTKDENEILARQQEGEQLVVKLRGQVYCIE